MAECEHCEWQLVPYGMGSANRLRSVELPQSLLQLLMLAVAQRTAKRRAEAASVHIPLEAVSVAMQFMDADTLCNAAQVCRDWNVLANQDALWTQLCRECYGVCPSCIHPSPKPVKMLYVRCKQSLRDLTRGIELGSLPTIPRSLFF